MSREKRYLWFCERHDVSFYSYSRKAMHRRMGCIIVKLDIRVDSLRIGRGGYYASGMSKVQLQNRKQNIVQ